MYIPTGTNGQYTMVKLGFIIVSNTVQRGSLHTHSKCHITDSYSLCGHISKRHMCQSEMFFKVEIYLYEF